jgi:pimeloyl-ACP methyl ester carboxylesterase
MQPPEAILPTHTNILPINDMHMYYEEYGHGYPLVLLHGGTSSCQTWQEFLPLLTPHFHLLTPDSRAHGHSDNPSGVLSYSQMADDIAKFIDEMKLTRPLVFGYSDGGQIALELGMRYPDLCAALVVGAAWYKFSPTYLDSLQTGGFTSPGEVDFERIQAQSADWVEELRTIHTSSSDPEYWKALLKQISALWWTPLDYTAADFQRITAPTLVVQGDQDGIIELDQAVDMFELIPNAELFIIPNANHFTAKSELSLCFVLEFLLRHINSV